MECIGDIWKPQCRWIGRSISQDSDADIGAVTNVHGFRALNDEQEKEEASPKFFLGGLIKLDLFSNERNRGPKIPLSNISSVYLVQVAVDVINENEQLEYFPLFIEIE